MASNRVLAKSINMPFLQSNNKFIYVSLLVVLSFFLLLDYVPGMHAYSAWVTHRWRCSWGWPLHCCVGRHIRSSIRRLQSIYCNTLL